jgi:hypothetical protein
MLDLVQAAAKLQKQLDGLDLPNCIIGGLALQAWGEVRVTRDVDFTVLTRFINEELKVRSILSLLTARRPDALAFALQNRVLLGYVDENISVDIGLGGFDYEERMVRRAVLFEFAESTWLRICSPEDLVIMKTFAGRDRDWADIEGILVRQEILDWDRIVSELSPLLELVEEPARLDRLLAMRPSPQ